ncbi:MAG TPA: hemerythrin domain-containing protein [Polyangiaceae bacterium]|nr:hemerythrin domain-containing protein [Polyangiaceae bacterium]
MSTHPRLVSFLQDQHRSVLRSLEALLTTKERAIKTRRQWFEKLESELYHHMLLEEEIIYPALESAAQTKQDLRAYRAARGEHEATKALLKELEGLDPASAEFSHKLKVLERSVAHHISDEEATLFPMVQQAFAPDELQALTRLLIRRHEELEAHRAWSEDALVMAFSAPH